MKGAKFVGIWILVISVALLTAVPSFCQKEEVIKIGTMRRTAIGFLLNHCEEAGLFAKHGVNVKAYYPEDEVPAFLYRRLDIAPISALEVAEFVNRGWDLTMFEAMAISLNRIIVRKDSPYHELKDLVGKKFGQYGWASGGTTQFQVVAKKFYDIDVAKDFGNIIAPPAALVALLDRGDVDCINLYEPLALKILATGEYRAVTDSFSDIWKEETGHPLLMTALAAHDDWLGTHLDEVKKIIAAFKEGKRYLWNHPEETAERWAKWIGIEDPKTIAQLGDFFKKMTDVDWTIELILAQEEFMKTAAEMKVIIEELPRKPVFRVVE